MKTYIKPEISIVEVDIESNILAGSDTVSATFSDEEVDEGYADAAKFGNLPQWDADLQED